jgi:hypothetical protein
MPDARLTRRVAGAVTTRLDELKLEEVEDPRHEHGRRWSLATLLRTIIVGLVAGMKSLAQVEHLTNELSAAARRLLRIVRRVPDTTVRELACKLEPKQLRGRLHRQAKLGFRRKALEPYGLPFGVIAMDGKGTAATAWDDQYAQRQPHSVGLGASGIVRTMSCTLVSSRTKVYLDAVPIAADTNEMGQFATAFDELYQTYRDIEQLKMISYDSGANSKDNATKVRQTGWHYNFRLDASQPTLFLEARRLLGRLPLSAAVAKTVDRTSKGTETRYLFITEEMAGYYGWDHLRTVVRVYSEKRDREGFLISQKEHEQDRYFLCSLPRRRLTDDQWLLLIRRHWGVENEGHNTLDKIFEEDEHPFIVADPQGMLAVMLLRRIAYNLLALFRGVTQRAEEKRLTPWRDVMRWFYNTLIAVTDAHLEGLRSPSAVAAVA